MLELGTGFLALFPLYLDIGSSHYQDLHFKHTSCSQKWTYFPSKIPPLHLVLTHKPLTLFPPFLPLVQHITHAFLSLPSPHFHLGDQEFTQYLITAEVTNTAVLRPLIFYLHYSPTFITGVLLPRTKIQTIISQCTGLSLSSHLISFISSDSWPCAFAFSLCSSVKYPLFFKAVLKIQLSNQHSSFLITGNLT